MATTKDLPHNDEAEKAVIGAMIASSSARTDILNTLDEEDFYEKNVNHRHIFKAIYNLFNKGISVDISSIVNELDANMKVLDASGGVEYLYEVQELYIGDRVAMHHRDIVKDLSLSRRFIKTMKNCINGFADKEFEDVSHYIAECEKKILEITTARRIGSFKTTGEVVDEVTNKIRLIKTHGEGKYCTGVPTGFETLDKYTQGWQKGSLIILAARPSVGKTALSISFAYSAAKETGKPVAYFSLEMAADAIVTRLLATRSQVNSMNLATGNLTDGDWIALDEGVNDIKKTQIYIDDTSAAKLSDIRTKAQKLKAAHPDLCCIFIDYLGLITTSRVGKDDASRQQEVAEISRSLKALARELEVPIVCLCQLSRASENRTDHTPKLSDLRDSGSIEQDADQVIFIYRKDYQNQSANKEVVNQPSDEPFGDYSETILYIAKNRNGKVGQVNLSFYKNIGKFVESKVSPGLEDM